MHYGGPFVAQPWPSAEQQERNRVRLLSESRRQMREYEQRYEIASERVEEEMAAGRLKETWETGEWVMLIRMVRHLSHAFPA